MPIHLADKPVIDPATGRPKHVTQTLPISSGLPTAARLSEGRKRYLHSLFTTALEGGIGYWAGVSEYAWMLPADQAEADARGYRPEDINGFKAVLHPAEGEWGVFDADHDTAPLEVTISVMERGLTLFAAYLRDELDSQGKVVAPENRRPLPDDSYYRQFLCSEASHGEQGDFDASHADQVVQWGLFGRGIYG